MASSAHHSARPPAAHEGPERPASGGPSGEESELQVKKLSPTGLVASGAAAATATVVGGQLGIAGTVIGAALTSVVSATALALYTDSVNRSRSTLKKVTAKGPKRSSASPSQSVHSSRTGSRGVGREDDLAALGLEGGSEGIAHDETPSSRRRIVKIALLAAVIALIGIAAVFGVQRVIGTELSPGTGQIQRTVTGNDSVAPRDGSSTTDDDQQDGTDTEQQEDGSPATERPDDSTDGTDTQQEDRSTQDENEAPQDTEAPAEQSGDSAPQGSGSTSNHGSRGSSQGDSGGQQGASAQRAAGAQQDSVTDAG